MVALAAGIVDQDNEHSYPRSAGTSSAGTRSTAFAPNGLLPELHHPHRADHAEAHPPRPDWGRPPVCHAPVGKVLQRFLARDWSVDRTGVARSGAGIRAPESAGMPGCTGRHVNPLPFGVAVS